MDYINLKKSDFPFHIPIFRQDCSQTVKTPLLLPSSYSLKLSSHCDIIQNLKFCFGGWPLTPLSHPVAGSDIVFCGGQQPPRENFVT